MFLSHSAINSYHLLFQYEFSGKVYKTVMEKMIEQGDKFIKTEQQRLKKLLDGKISEEKRKQLVMRSNILESFQHATKKVADEL